MTSKFTKYLKTLITVLGIAMAIFHLYTAFFGPFTALLQRNIHLAFGLVIGYLIFIDESKSTLKNIWYITVCLLSILTSLYFILEFEAIVYRFGTPNMMDLIAGFIIIVLVIDFTRRTAGKVLTGIAIIFIAYALFGNYIPGSFGHRGYDLSRIINQISITTEGIFGIPLGVSAEFIYLFILFGALLKVTGIAQYYIDISTKMVGKSPGGPAKAAIVASGFFGSISGSAVANVSGTGTVTIPLMKSIGYRKEFAGGVEAVASTGGQFMPPLMGASAFIMAEIIGIPYYQVALGALIPALIYYGALFGMVHFRAHAEGLTGSDTSKLPPLKKLFLSKFIYFLPIVALTYFLLVAQLSVMKSAVYAVLITLIIGAFITKRPLNAFKEAIVDAVRTSLVVIASTACAGIIVGVVNLTGVGLKFSSLIISFAEISLLLILVMLMLASILLGMGLPTTPAYLILAVLGAPALIRIGIEPLPAHMFVFYFGAISMITPPVALAVYAASSIAKSNFWKTAWSAVLLGLSGFIIPYMFVYNPAMLGLGSKFEVLLSGLTGLFGAVLLGAGLAGWLLVKTTIIQRTLLIVSGLLLITPNEMINFGGFIGFLIILILQWISRKKVMNAEKIAQ